MTRKAVISIIILLAAMPPFFSTAENRAAADSVTVFNGPHLKLADAVLNLGLISADTVTSGTIEFINDGNSPLVIKDMFADCGCTVPSYPKKPIQPGEKATITVRFNSRNRNPGSFRKTVRIRSNAINSREFFSVTGKVKRVWHQ